MYKLVKSEEGLDGAMPHGPINSDFQDWLA